PTIRLLVVGRCGHARVESDHPPEIEAVGNMVQVAKDLGLPGISLRPLPLLLELGRERERIVHARHVAPRARIAVPVPRATDTAPGLKAAGRESELPEPPVRVQAGKTGTYHH